MLYVFFFMLFVFCLVFMLIFVLFLCLFLIFVFIVFCMFYLFFKQNRVFLIFVGIVIDGNNVCLFFKYIIILYK